MTDFFLREFGKGPDFVADLTPDQCLNYANGGKGPTVAEEWISPDLMRAMILAKRKG